MTEDQRLFRGLKAGDRKAIKQIYRLYLPGIVYWVKSNNGSKQDAEDIFHECLEMMLIKIETLNASLSGLIQTICQRRWIDNIRKNKTANRVRNEWETRHIKENGEASEYDVPSRDYHRYKIMDQTFKNLSETCQQLLMLLRSGLTNDEIVRQMAFNSMNTLYRRKAACIARWSQLVKSFDIHE